MMELLPLLLMLSLAFAGKRLLVLVFEILAAIQECLNHNLRSMHLLMAIAMQRLHHQRYINEYECVTI